MAPEVKGLNEGIFDSTDSTACTIAFEYSVVLEELSCEFRPRKVNGKWCKLVMGNRSAMGEARVL